ncbi:hypothetical protein D3C71_1885850 [compost metagenome]
MLGPVARRLRVDTGGLCLCRSVLQPAERSLRLRQMRAQRTQVHMGFCTAAHDAQMV